MRPALLRSLALLLVVAAAPHSSGAQLPRAPADSIARAAAQALVANHGDSARVLLQGAARDAAGAELRARYQLYLGDAYMFDGRFADAARAYGQVLGAYAARVGDSLTSRAHYGMALAEAFSGRALQAKSHFAEALRAPPPIADAPPRFAALADTIGAMIFLKRYDAAQAALDRSDRLGGAAPNQFTQAFRGLALMELGQCRGALAAVDRAPRQSRPMIWAVRARCAADQGKRDLAAAYRDSVFSQPIDDPFTWPMITARHVARQLR